MLKALPANGLDVVAIHNRIIGAQRPPGWLQHPQPHHLLEPVMDLNSNSFGRSTDTLPAKAYQAGVRLMF